jgi:hypothetical protein
MDKKVKLHYMVITWVSFLTLGISDILNQWGDERKTFLLYHYSWKGQMKKNIQSRREEFGDRLHQNDWLLNTQKGRRHAHAGYLIVLLSCYILLPYSGRSFSPLLYFSVILKINRFFSYCILTVRLIN